MADSYMQPPRRQAPRSLDGFLLSRPHAPLTSREARSPRPEAQIRPVQARIPQPGHSRPTNYAPAPKTAAAQPRPKPNRAKRPPRLKGLFKITLQVCALVGLVILGTLMRVVLVGQVLVVVYAITALVLRVESRTTFLLTMMALGMVILSSLRSDPELANAYAMYAFLLLVVGTVSLAREVRSEI